MAKIDPDSITDAALKLIESGSYGELTLAAIARELDVTQPALYYHLDGIDDVLRMVGLKVRNRLHDQLSRATIGRSGADAVRAVAVSWRQFSQENPQLYRSTSWHSITGDDELEQAVQRVLAVLTAALRSFNLDGTTSTHAALAMRSALHGFCSFELGAGNPSIGTADDCFDAVVDLLLTGIEARSRGNA